MLSAEVYVLCGCDWSSIPGSVIVDADINWGEVDVHFNVNIFYNKVCEVKLLASLQQVLSAEVYVLCGWDWFTQVAPTS